MDEMYKKMLRDKLMKKRPGALAQRGPSKEEAAAAIQRMLEQMDSDSTVRESEMQDPESVLREPEVQETPEKDVFKFEEGMNKRRRRFKELEKLLKSK